MFIDYLASRAEELALAQKSYIRLQEQVTALAARGDSPYLHERLLARMEEERGRVAAIEDISEKEWQCRHSLAVTVHNAFVRHMELGNAALWENPHTTKEEVVRFLTGE